MDPDNSNQFTPLKREPNKPLTPLDIPGTHETPALHFDSNNNIFSIKGRSIPEDHAAFYEPVLNWLDEFSTDPPSSQIRVEVELEYFNTSSSKFLLKIFKKLEFIHDRLQNVSLEWIYEEDDMDMMECGQDYHAILHFPFKMVEVPER